MCSYQSKTRSFDVGPLIALGLAVAVVSWISSRRNTTQAFQTLPWRNQMQKWEITPQGLTLTCDAFTSTMKWDMVQKIAWQEDGFLVYPSAGDGHWLPKDAFDSDEQIAMFRNMAQEQEHPAHG